MLTVTRLSPASFSGCASIGEQVAVGGERDVEWLAVGGAKLREFADKIDHAFAQQRLAAGEAHFLDTEAGEYARHAQVVGERQVGILRAIIAGTAVDALVVAVVGDGDPEIGDGAAEFVGEWQVVRSLVVDR